MPRLFALITLLSLPLALTAPAAGQSTTGGTEASEPVAATGGHPITASDGRISVSARADAVLGRTLHFRGHVPAEEAGRTVAIERLDEKKGQWVVATTAPAGEGGHFLARWRTDTVGRLRLRARVTAGSARAATASPELGLTVYRQQKATWYGPGFYGRTTACKQTMSRTLVGVAHRTLPCGTKVAVMYKGRVMTVPVVDRGPFANGAHWDLTYAAAQALGFEYTDVIGVARLRDPAATAKKKR
jgi:hypothetical protein